MRLPRSDQGILRVADAAAWKLCSYADTALVGGAVELMWQHWPAKFAPPPATTPTLGLAFDRYARAIRSVTPSASAPCGRLETLHANAVGVLTIAAPVEWTLLPATPLQGCAGAQPAGDDLLGAIGPIATTAPDLLWVCDAPGKKIWRYDLLARKYLSFWPLPTTPCAIASAGAESDFAIVLVEQADGSGGWFALRACSAPQPLDWPQLNGAPLPSGRAIALAADGTAWVLFGSGAKAVVRELGSPFAPSIGTQIAVPNARALACGNALIDALREPEAKAGTRLFVTTDPGQAWRSFDTDGAEDRPLVAPGYDGGAIAAGADGRIAYVAEVAGTAELRYLVPTRLARALRGTMLSFRLDSEQYRTSWGRVLLEACIAPNTRMEVRCIASDEDEVEVPAARSAPANFASLVVDESVAPPLPEALLLEAAQAQPARTTVPRADGGLRGRSGFAPWVPATPGFAWLESWADGQGRYLWIEVTLYGDGWRSPRLRSVEVEYPGHAWLRQLPQLFSREAAAADFLLRYLAGPANLFGDLGAAADARHRLLDPNGTPREVLDWLAALLGIAFDRCWPEAARRQLIAEAGALARRKGTVETVRRTVEILAGAPVLLIEAFRLRAPGVIGSTGEDAAPAAGAVLGAGIRLGSAAVGTATVEVAASVVAPQSASAWRFTLLVQAPLADEELDCLRAAVEKIKPAHTALTLCALESGLRVGRGLHLDLAALIGPDSGLPTPLLGQTRLGHETVVGRPLGPTGADSSC
jgi:phage tail-like protein